MPFEEFPIEGTPIPKGYDGWFILLDELSSANKAVQSASYKLILDRMVGNHKLHDNVLMMAAGNLMSDGAIVNDLSTALQSRMIHFHLEFCKDSWLEWAAKKQLDYRVLGYLNFKDQNIYRFNPQHNDLTYPCGRTWEFMSDIIKPMSTVPLTKLPLLTGTVGQAVGTEFLHYMDLYTKIPKIEDVLKDSDCVDLQPDTPANILFAVVGIVQAHMSTKTANNLMKLVNRIPRMEMQVTCLIGVLKHKPELMSLPAITDWTMRNHAEISGVMEDDT